MFGAATANCNKAEAVGVAVTVLTGVGVLVAVSPRVTSMVGATVGVRVPTVPNTLKSDTIGAGPPGVQVARGLQEGGAPPDAVTRSPW